MVDSELPISGISDSNLFISVLMTARECSARIEATNVSTEIASFLDKLGLNRLKYFRFGGA